MKILITGATGFVGKMLLPLLVEKGHEIIVLTRDIVSASVRLPVACKIIECDPEKTLTHIEDDIDTIINFCVEILLVNVGPQKENKQSIMRESYQSVISLTFFEIIPIP